MRRLLPEPAHDVDPYEAYRPTDPDEPLLRLDMVMSADGSVTDAAGRSGGLGGAGDLTVYRVLRAHADGIVVGAGTARVEGYGPHRMPADLAERRAADGRPDPAAIVVVSRSLGLDPSTPLFVEARRPTIVLTCQSAPADRRAALERVATVVVAGDASVDLAGGIRRLRAEHGLAQLVAEGGPTLNDGLLAGAVVDELCLTLAPLLVPGTQRGLVEGLASSHPLELRHVLEQDGELFLRYAVGQ